MADHRSIACAAVVAACATSPHPLPQAESTPTSTSTPTPISTPTSTPTLAPLAGDAFTTVELASGKSAVVSLPLGATAPRPLLVATHGAGGRAEAQCALWRSLLSDVFVLCPRGVTISTLPPEERHYFYPDHLALAAEIDQALAALRERYGAYLDASAPIYAGYSQGAGMGAMALPTHAAEFARAVLIEGGFGEYHEWDIPTARRYAEHGGRRVLFVCGRAKCAELARQSASWLERGGLAARVAFVDGAGHDIHALEARLAAELAWLTEGDDRFRSTSPAPRAEPATAPRSKTTPR